MIRDQEHSSAVRLSSTCVLHESKQDCCFESHNDSNNFVIVFLVGQSQWPHGLWHEMSSPAQTLGSWVQITLKA
jgi:hypothetical protein